MADKLRTEYMSEVATQNAKGLQRIKALQRFFQVGILPSIFFPFEIISPLFLERWPFISTHQTGQENIQVIATSQDIILFICACMYILCMVCD